MAPCYDLFASYRHHQLPRYYSAYEDDPEALGQNAFAYLWDPVICLYANPPLTLIWRVLAKIANEGSRVLLVTPHWRAAPWYGLLNELTVRSYYWRGGGWNLKWFHSEVIHHIFLCGGERRVLTEAKLATELAGEPTVENDERAKTGENEGVAMLFCLLSAAKTKRTGAESELRERTCGSLALGGE